MFQTLIPAFMDEISGLGAKNYVAEITRFHRMQASPGFRAAAEYVAETIQGQGLDARILSFPADGRATFWSMRSFLEWDCEEASLFLLNEQGEVADRLADYREEKISLIQRSASAEGEFEVVVVDEGEEQDDYEGLDVEGKVVLTGGDVGRVLDLAVKQRGAAGILFDGMRKTPPVRERIDLPDARQYTSFWFRGDETVPVFGFVLTPRQGDALREQCREAGSEDKPPVRVRAKVVSRIYPGQMEVMEATLAGETSEEIVLIAHLCHPQPSANDNASGAGALMEIARALAANVRSGKLSKPRRTIRFLWVPEMSGTYAYLALREQDLPQMIAGLNLDMVGENQDLCGSSLLVESPPAALSSFAPDLAQFIRDRLLGGAKSHAGQGDFPLFRYADTPFSGGSDHYILSDPTVGVPTPMIIQWPDRFYHTGADTIDKVDPTMLANVGVLTSTYAYWLASARRREAEWLAHEMHARFRISMVKRVQDALSEGMDGEAGDAASLGKLEREVAFRVCRHSDALATLKRLADVGIGPLQASAAAFAEGEMKRAKSLLGNGAPGASAPSSDEWERKAASLVPTRRYRGPLSIRDLMTRPQDKETFYRLGKEHKAFIYSHAVLAVYWTDGARTIADIAELVELETGKRSTESLVKFFEFLAQIGGIELRGKESK